MVEIIPRRRCCLHLFLEASRDLRWRRNRLHMFKEDISWVSHEVEASMPSSRYKISLDVPGLLVQSRLSTSFEETVKSVISNRKVTFTNHHH